MTARDPATRLEAAFARIARERMAGVGLCHPRLVVEAVGFTRWSGLSVGVLITPWAMNLVLLPDAEALPPLAVGSARSWRFPSGEYACMGGEEAGVGAFHYCSLFSPMNEFADQDAARAVARAVIEALFEVPPAAGRRAFLRGAVGRTERA